MANSIILVLLNKGKSKLLYNMAAPKIVLYTNHACPWAHRAHIALSELGLPFEEHIIDLGVPRTQEYLAINPRGLVPTLIYNGETIPESGIVAQFLADQHPSHLVKTSSEPGGALQRARINFFVDAFVNKVTPSLGASIRAKDDAEKTEAADKLVAGLVKEVEPLLKDAAPFFGGSSKLTLAEVLTGSFVLRVVDYPEQGLLSSGLHAELASKAPNTLKWLKAVAAEKSVNSIWNAKSSAEGIRKKFGVK